MSPDALIAAGCAAGLLEGLCVQPLDMVKTRFQLNAQGNSSIYRELVNLIREGGVGRLYRGCAPELAANVANRGALFVSQQHAEDLARPYLGTVVTPCFGGFCAGIPEALASTPFQVVKVRLQSKEHLGRYRNPSHCIISMLRDGPPRQFFAGLGPTAVRNCVWNCVYFGILPWGRQASDWLGAPPAAGTFLAPFCCGCIATCFNAPFDVATSRVQRQLPGQSKYGGTLQTLASIAREEGIRACYKGLAPKVLRMGFGYSMVTPAYKAIVARIDGGRCSTA